MPFSSLLYLIKKDVLAVYVLPRVLVNRFKSFADFIDREESTDRGKSIVTVILSLDVLIMKEQVIRFRETRLRWCG